MDPAGDNVYKRCFTATYAHGLNPESADDSDVDLIAEDGADHTLGGNMGGGNGEGSMSGSMRGGNGEGSMSGSMRGGNGEGSMSGSMGGGGSGDDSGNDNGIDSSDE